MKKLLLSVVATIMFTALVWSQSENSLLWGVVKEGQNDTSYVFGTIHLLCPEDFVMNDRLKKAVSSSGELVLELDFDDPQLQGKMMTLALMSDGTELKDLMSEEDYTFVASYFQDTLQMPIQYFTKWKPFLLSTFPLLHSLDCTPISVEQSLQEFATAQSIPITGLETVEEQMAVIDKLPYDKQASALVESLREYQETVKITGEMYSLYRKQDVDGLYKLTEEYFDSEMAELESELLAERNANWIPKIIEMTSEGSYFFGVGAAHLGGENGILELLRKSDYEVFPVVN